MRRGGSANERQTLSSFNAAISAKKIDPESAGQKGFTLGLGPMCYAKEVRTDVSH